MADMIKFQQGLLANLSGKAINNGTLWFTTDEGAIYLDTNGKRVRFGDYIMVDKVSDLPSAGHAYESALYYVKEDNILARYDKTNAKWIQLNAAGLSDIAVNGEGNVISGVKVELDDKGRRKLTFTTASVATSESFNALSQDVADLKAADTTIRGEFATADENLKKELLGEVATDDYKTIKALSDAVKENASDISDHETRLAAAEGTIAGHTTDISDLKAKDQTIEKSISDMDAAYKAADLALEKKIVAGNGGNSEFATGDYKNINDLSAAIKAAEGRLDSAEGTIGGHTTDISDLKSKVGDLETAVGTGDVQNRIDTAVANLRKEILTDGTANDNINDAYDTIQEIATWLGENQLGKDAGQIIEELNGLTATVGGHTTAIADLVAEDTDIRNDFAAADTAVKEALIGASTASGEYKTINALSGAVEQNETDIDGLDQRLTAAEGTIAGHTTTIGDHTTAISDLQAADTTIRGEFAAADTALKTAIMGQADATGIEYATVKALSEHVKTAEGDIDALEGTVGTHTTQISDLTTLLTWGEF